MNGTALGPKHIGARIKRVEDPRLLAGQGAFADDRVTQNALHLALRRSDHAHARIASIDVKAAATLPGIFGLYTAADLDGAVAPVRATRANSSAIFRSSGSTPSIGESAPPSTW